jgi:hypothetical protein
MKLKVGDDLPPALQQKFDSRLAELHGENPVCKSKTNRRAYDLKRNYIDAYNKRNMKRPPQPPMTFGGSPNPHQRPRLAFDSPSIASAAAPTNPTAFGSPNPTSPILQRRIVRAVRPTVATTRSPAPTNPIASAAAPTNPTAFGSPPTNPIAFGSTNPTSPTVLQRRIVRAVRPTRSPAATPARTSPIAFGSPNPTYLTSPVPIIRACHPRAAAFKERRF